MLLVKLFVSRVLFTDYPHYCLIIVDKFYYCLYILCIIWQFVAWIVLFIILSDNSMNCILIRHNSIVDNFCGSTAVADCEHVFVAVNRVYVLCAII